MQIRVVNFHSHAYGMGMFVMIETTGDEGRARQKLLLSEEQFAQLQIEKGPVSEARYEEIVRAAEYHKTMRSAVNMLSYGAKSQKELTRRLVRKGANREDAAGVTARLAQKGLIQETDDARREAERCIKKNWSRRRIIAHLFQKGYGDAVVKEVNDFFLAEVDFVRICEAAIRSKMGHDRNNEDIDRVIGAMSRAGFSMAEIKTAIKNIIQ